MSDKEQMWPKQKRPSLWQKLKWKIENTRITICSIPHNIKMIAQWIPVLWNNWDWDYNFLLDVMEYKLRRMSNHMSKYDRLVKSEQCVNQMAICADLIKRIRKDEYIGPEGKKHEEKWGELKIDNISVKDFSNLCTMDFYRTKAREQGKEEEERKETLALHDLALQRRNKDLDVLFRIMRKRIESWCD